MYIRSIQYVFFIICLRGQNINNLERRIQDLNVPFKRWHLADNRILASRYRGCQVHFTCTERVPPPPPTSLLHPRHSCCTHYKGNRQAKGILRIPDILIQSDAQPAWYHNTPQMYTRRGLAGVGLTPLPPRFVRTCTRQRAGAMPRRGVLLGRFYCKLR